MEEEGLLEGGDRLQSLVTGLGELFLFWAVFYQVLPGLYSVLSLAIPARARSLKASATRRASATARS